MLIICSAIAVNSQLERGQRAFAALRYEQALERFTDALRTAENTDERAQAYLYMAICRFELGDEQEARRALRDALVLDRDATLPALASPKIEAALAEERAWLAVADSAPTVAPLGVGAAASPFTPAPRLPHWPSIAAGGVALGLVTTGLLIGLSAKSRRDDAERARFAADAQTLDASAQARGRTANVLYGAGAAFAGLALVYEIAF